MFSDLAITTALMVKRVLSMREVCKDSSTQFFKLAQLPFSCPHYSYISKREVFTRTNWPRRHSCLGSREHSTLSFISLT
ncbi:hypothetical protein HJ201_18460 [Vibrio parahaemolyticus]|nr:hypothetical protein [Vibrio parahaemolyticus]MBE4231916.1 hypothetical protein [Vibrio parahaemolyticus]